MERINIGARSENEAERELSNFAAWGFTLDNIRLASREGFIIGLMLVEGGLHQELAFSSVGFEAKKLARHALRQWIWWNGKRFPFRGHEHVELIERGIRACFEQNPRLMKILLSTTGKELTHDLGRPEKPNTSLPAKEFCNILTKIREENLKKGFSE